MLFISCPCLRSSLPQVPQSLGLKSATEPELVNDDFLKQRQRIQRKVTCMGQADCEKHRNDSVMKDRMESTVPFLAKPLVHLSDTRSAHTKPVLE